MAEIRRDIHLVIASEQMAVRQALAQLLADPGLRHLRCDLRGRIEIVLAEVLNNIVEHAYAEQRGNITIDVSIGPNGIGCCILDGGAAMPGLALPEGKLAPHDPQDLPEGGFGWFLIRTLTEDLSYRRQGNMNELRFRMPETICS
ncbi:MAG TPA: ATP-binding protein [Gemmobacter sp.]|mgnify:CR=1 FL=1|nr:ATP-binding protein [Gemmobacter sp.]